MAAILFNHPRAVMVRIAKTGSTSIVRGLFGGISADDQVHHGPPLQEWLRYFSFGFVRNPFDRLVSAFLMFRNHRQRNAEEEARRQQLSIGRMLDLISDDSVPLGGEGWLSRLRAHCIPITHPHHRLDLVDRVYRFEDFQQSYIDLAKELGVRPLLIPHCRRSERRDWRSYYTRSEFSRARDIFAADCETYGYSADPAWLSGAATGKTLWPPITTPDHRKSA